MAEEDDDDDGGLEELPEANTHAPLVTPPEHADEQPPGLPPDLESPQTPEPEPPPLTFPDMPPRPPPKEKINIKPVDGGAEITRVSTQRQVVATDQIGRALAGGHPPGASAQYPGVMQEHASAAAYFNQQAAKPDCSSWQVSVRRQGPSVWKGKRLLSGADIETLSIADIKTLTDQIKDLHGGGTYVLYLKDDSGMAKCQLRVSIPTANCPPIPPATGDDDDRRSPYGGLPGHKDDSESAKAADEARAARIRADLAKAKSEEKQAEIKGRIEVEAMEQHAKEAKEDGMGGGGKEMVAAMMAMNEKMMANTKEMMLAQQQAQKEQQQQNREMLEKMLTANRETITALTAKKDDGGAGVNIIVEAMKATAATNQQVLATIAASASAGKEDQMKFLQMMIEHNKDNKGGGTAEEILKTVLPSIINQPKQSLQDSLKLIESGKQQMQEMYEIASQNAQEPPRIDESQGWMTNIANILMQMFAQRRQEPAMQSVVGQAIGQPALAGPYSDQQAQQAAQVIAPRVAGALTGRQFPALTMSEQPAMPAQQPQQVVAMNPPPAPIVVDAAAEARLVDSVTDVLGTAIEDLQDERRQPRWIDEALADWPRNFLENLSKLQPTDMVPLLQTRCQAAMWNSLNALIMQNPAKYKLFTDGLQLLVTRFQQPLAALPNPAIGSGGAGSSQLPPGVTVTGATTPPPVTTP